MEEEREDAGSQAKPAKKLPLIPIIIVVVGVIVLGAGAFIFLKMGNKPAPKVEGRGEVSATDAAPGTVEKISPNPLYYFEGEFKVNTKDSAFASAKIVLELEDYYFVAGSSSDKKGAKGEKAAGEGGGEAKPAEGGAEATAAGGGEATGPQGLLAQQIDENLPKLRDFIITEFNGMTSAELTSAEGKGRLKKDIIDYINKQFSGTAGKVVNLYFEELIVAQ
jgi:flagellar basal body-associated protein FliL